MGNEEAFDELRLPRYGISAAARRVGCAENTMRALDDVLQPFRDSAGRRLYTDQNILAARQHLGRRRIGDRA